jgi:hypothetical protein
MGCLFAVFAGAFPRFSTLLIWMARPAMFSAAFGGSWLWPLLGIAFLPFTTLMYVVLWSAGRGVSGFDWFWLILAGLVDIGGWFGSGYANRDRMPNYARA